MWFHSLLLSPFLQEEEEGIKMQISNFVPTVNEAAATYKGLCQIYMY